MSGTMTKQLIKLLASDVDFQSRLSPADRITVLFSQPDEDGDASDDSELLYASATFGGATHTYYRYQMKDGSIDYFDQDGRSARQFLFRNPVPGVSRISRGFGMERHPILGIMRMHTGVDYATPRGTPSIQRSRSSARSSAAGSHTEMASIASPGSRKASESPFPTRSSAYARRV